MQKILCTIPFFFLACQPMYNFGQVSNNSPYKVDAVLKSIGPLEGSNHIIFASGDSYYLLLIEDEDSIRECFIIAKDTSSVMIIADTTYNKSRSPGGLFEKSNYIEGLTTFKSTLYEDGYDIASGSMTYFAFIDENGNRYSEAQLSFFIKPNPIPIENYLFLISRILLYASRN